MRQGIPTRSEPVGYMTEQRNLGSETTKIKVGQYLVEDIEDGAFALWNIFEDFDQQDPMVFRGGHSTTIKASLFNAYANVSLQAATWYLSGVIDGLIHPEMMKVAESLPPEESNDVA
jgi:hypothetical protein